jgi:hypothetical protein
VSKKGGIYVSAIEYKDQFKKYELAPYFPTCPSQDETGGKSGCIVLTNNTTFAQKLDLMKTIKKYLN